MRAVVIPTEMRSEDRKNCLGRALNRKIILESTAVMESIAEKVEIKIRKRLEELEAEVRRQQEAAARDALQAD